MYNNLLFSNTIDYHNIYITYKKNYVFTKYIAQNCFKLNLKVIYVQYTTVN